MNNWIKESVAVNWVGFTSSVVSLFMALCTLITFAISVLFDHESRSPRDRLVWERLHTDFDWPVQFLVFLILCVVFGWALGFLLSHFSRMVEPHWHFLAYFLSIFWGVLMVAIARHLTNPKSTDISLQIHVFSLIGLAVTLNLMIFQFRAHDRFNDVDVIERRARAVLTYAGTALAMLLLAGISS